MKKSKILALIMAVVIIASCFAACGNEVNNPIKSKVLVMGVDAEYPPFSNLGDNGEYTGFDVEVCKAVCDYLGWELKIFAVNWDQKLEQLDAGECDCVWSGMTILPSMTEAGYIISKPYFENEQVLVVKADSKLATSKDLAGKDVAVELGTSGEELLANDLKELADTFNKVVTCNSFLSCFTELEGGAVDAVFVDKPVAAAYVAEHEGLVIIDEDLGAEQYGIAFRSGSEDLAAEIEKALNAIVENGTYKKIADSYEDINNDKLLLLK